MKKYFQKTLICIMTVSAALGRINAQNTKDTVAVHEPSQDSITAAGIQKIS